MQVPFHAVLCPTDLSATGNLAVPLAYRLAGSGATVHLLHVCEPPFLGNPLYNQFVQGYVPTPDEIHSGEERARAEFHKLPPPDAIDHGVRTQVHLETGTNVANVIEDVARKLEVDVVVLGTHGRTGLSRLVMGSVATEVVKKERLPVVLVHQDEID